MTLLQRILLIPSLLPLVVVLVLSVLHRGEPTRLHLLGWSSPEVPLGVWTALAATGAAGLAASSSILSCRIALCLLGLDQYRRADAGYFYDSFGSAFQPPVFCRRRCLFKNRSFANSDL